MRTMRKATRALLFAGLCAGCGDNSITAPYPKNLVIEVVAGDDQFAAPGALAPEPLQVRITHVRTGAPVPGMSVNWRIVQGAGSELTDGNAPSDNTGLAVTRIRLGSALGDYRIEATFPGLFEKPATFTLHTAPVPSITSIEPQSARAGETVVIRGQDFSAIKDANAVFFDGLRATITASSVGELRAIVPPCVSTRQAQVRVLLGSLISAPVSLDVRGENGTPLQLAIGEVRHFADPASASCVRLPEKPAGAAYLVVTQNAGSDGRHQLAFQLAGVTGSLEAPALYPAGVARARALSAAEVWEAQLRQKERALLRRGVRRPTLSTAARISTPAAAPPAPGDVRGFNVITARGQIRRVTGVVRAVGVHSVIYQDRNAPEGGFTANEFAELVRLFDDPIQPTDVDVFGEPSDIDGNRRVLILLTPATNELTPAGETSYIAGYINSDDLDFCVPDGEFPCAGNSAEVIYTVVPDADGKHGLKHTSAQLLRTLPSTLAHEFQHMIHLNQRILHGVSEEMPWLMEALAHTAEDTVGGVLLQRGDSARAHLFRSQNYQRAAFYLADPARVSIVGDDGGSLEERGGGWLLLKYLTGHFGTDLLGRLTRSTAMGTTTLTAATGTQWSVLLSRWAIALHGAASNVTPLDVRYRYTNFDLRGALASIKTQATPYQPRALSFSDFVVSGALPDGGASFAILAAGAQLTSLNLSLGGLRGAPFASGTRPQLTVLRLK